MCECVVCFFFSNGNSYYCRRNHYALYHIFPVQSKDNYSTQSASKKYIQSVVFSKKNTEVCLCKTHNFISVMKKRNISLQGPPGSLESQLIPKYINQRNTV